MIGPTCKAIDNILLIRERALDLLQVSRATPATIDIAQLLNVLASLNVQAAELEGNLTDLRSKTAKQLHYG